MTVKEGAIISAYTGLMLCESFTPVHDYIEHILGRPVLTHEIPSLQDEIKEKARDDFYKIIRQQS